MHRYEECNKNTMVSVVLFISTVLIWRKEFVINY